MQLPDNWRQLLKMPSRRKVALVTIVFGSTLGLDRQREHLARNAGAYRFSTGEGVVVPSSNGQELPFWPQLIQWPEVTYTFTPHERRAETSPVNIVLQTSAINIDDIIPFGGGSSGYARVDLWMDGLTLEEVLPLAEGELSGITTDKSQPTLTLQLTDRPKDFGIKYPQVGTIESDEFPGVRDPVAGKRGRWVIWGPLVGQLPCPQIGERDYYFAEDPISDPPNRFFVGGTEITNETSQRPAVMFDFGAVTGTKYWKLRFPDSLANLGLTGEVTAMGGKGITFSGQSPIELLLDAGKFQVDAESKSRLRALNSSFSILTNKQGEILSLVRDRLIPQTNLAMFFRLGKIRFLPTTGLGIPSKKMEVGSDLLFSLSTQAKETDLSKVFNVITVQTRRDVAASVVNDTRLINETVVDRIDGRTQSIRQRLAVSERLYGRRQLVVEAADLYVQSEAQALGESLADLHAFVHRAYDYQADWIHGLEIDTGWRIFLTDDDRSFSDEPTRVVRQTISASGPIISLQTEDLLSRVGSSN